VQDYLPSTILYELLEHDWEDDAIENPADFDPTIDFWVLYRNKLEHMGENLAGWHVGKQRVSTGEETDEMFEEKMDALAEKVAAEEGRVSKLASMIKKKIADIKIGEREA
jgi:hypothetical protein